MGAGDRVLRDGRVIQVSTDEDPVAWLRQLLERCLEHHRQVAGSEDAGEDAARCEAELAILDKHAPRNGYDQPEGDLTLICACCADDRMYGYAYPCRTVRLLLSGYRFRPGWREEWAPTP
jgi:Family of unknown function (DUF6221)